MTDILDNAVWKAQEGGQKLVLSCPIPEILVEGDRGGGKSDVALFKFAQYIDKGFGSAWKGLIFRREFKDLEDIIGKAKKWFGRVFPEARFLDAPSSYKYVWPTGEQLLFRHVKKPQDYSGFHGQEFPFQDWEEITNWPDDSLYLDMQSCARSSVKGVPVFILCTTNSFGVGHAWVKERFRPGSNRIIEDEFGNKRVSVKLLRRENKALFEADPTYEQRLKAITASDPNKRKAWVENSWDISSGGIIDDLWNPELHCIEPFEVPRSWKIDRSFDWGSSKPYSVGWWAESDGNPAYIKGKWRHFPSGTLFRIYEVYGFTGSPNKGTQETTFQIAERILDVDQSRFENNVSPGAADASIFDEVDGNCMAWNMADKGIDWNRSDKSKGSRILGASIIRQLLYNATMDDKEYPHLYVFDNCTQFLRTVPFLGRDPVQIDDVDTSQEDHIWDEMRYRVLDSGLIKSSVGFQITGM
jgi:hypothetical protein